MEAMKLTIDKRHTHIVYVDKSNYQYAQDNEIIKLVNNGNYDPIKNVTSIIAATNKLRIEEANVLYIVSKAKDNTSLTNAYKEYADAYNKSRSTFDRAIKGLKDKSIIRVNCSDVIIINPAYKCSNIKEDIKYIVIELNPDNTSNGVDV